MGNLNNWPAILASLDKGIKDLLGKDNLYMATYIILAWDEEGNLRLLERGEKSAAVYVNYNLANHG